MSVRCVSVSRLPLSDKSCLLLLPVDRAQRVYVCLWVCFGVGWGWGSRSYGSFITSLSLPLKHSTNTQTNKQKRETLDTQE